MTLLRLTADNIHGQAKRRRDLANAEGFHNTTGIGC